MQEPLLRHVGTAEATRLGVELGGTERKSAEHLLPARTRLRQNASAKSENSLVRSKAPNENHPNRP